VGHFFESLDNHGWIIMAVVFVFKIMTLHSNAGSIGGLAWMKMMVRSMASISKDIYM
jgi:hypothetical protein